VSAFFLPRTQFGVFGSDCESFFLFKIEFLPQNTETHKEFSAMSETAETAFHLLHLQTVCDDPTDWIRNSKHAKVGNTSAHSKIRLTIKISGMKEPSPENSAKISSKVKLAIHPFPAIGGLIDSDFNSVYRTRTVDSNVKEIDIGQLHFGQVIHLSFVYALNMDQIKEIPSNEAFQLLLSYYNSFTAKDEVVQATVLIPASLLPIEQPDHYHQVETTVHETTPYMTTSISPPVLVELSSNSPEYDIENPHSDRFYTFHLNSTDFIEIHPNSSCKMSKSNSSSTTAASAMKKSSSQDHLETSNNNPEDEVFSLTLFNGKIYANASSFHMELKDIQAGFTQIIFKNSHNTKESPTVQNKVFFVENPERSHFICIDGGLEIHEHLPKRKQKLKLKSMEEISFFRKAIEPSAEVDVTSPHPCAVESFEEILSSLHFHEEMMVDSQENRQTSKHHLSNIYRSVDGSFRDKTQDELFHLRDDLVRSLSLRLEKTILENHQNAGDAAAVLFSKVNQHNIALFLSCCVSNTVYFVLIDYS
jgi:hypothetical protein